MSEMGAVVWLPKLKQRGFSAAPAGKATGITKAGVQQLWETLICSQADPLPLMLSVVCRVGSFRV